MKLLSCILIILECLAVFVSAETYQPGQSHISLSRYQFPASKTCRLISCKAGENPDVTYTTFMLTITIDDFEVRNKGSFRISFGYKYDGKYRLETVYKKHFSWPLPQVEDALAPNYVTARIVNNPVEVRSTLSCDSSSYGLVIRFNSYGNEFCLERGSQVQLIWGDTTGGSPGYMVPPLAYDIDLVIEQDADADGTYEMLDAIMPTLRIAASAVDTLPIVAPSMPKSNTFSVIVKAIQGFDESKTNMNIVPGYSGTIHFTSTDQLAVLPEDYTFLPDDAGVRTFAVTLNSAGTHRIFVESVDDGVVGASNPVFIPSACGQDKDAQQAFIEMIQGKRLFWGSLHQHTNIGGHGAQTPQYAYDYARSTSGLDFFSLSEHCERDHYDWNFNRQLVEDYYDPGRFVTFAAYEWCERSYGHRHVVMFGEPSDECYCAHRFGNQTTSIAPTLQDLFDSYAGRDALLILHHAAWRYEADLRTPESDNVLLGDPGYPNQCLFEIYSHHGSSESYDNEPYVIHGDKSHQWERSAPAYFQNAIAAGYKFGVTADGDNHMGMPGGHVESSSIEDSDYYYSRLGITGVYADTLTRGGIWEALSARRTYGTTGARIIMAFSVNNAIMGEEIVSSDYPAVEACVIGTDTIQTITVFRNGNEIVYESHPGGSETYVSFMDRNVHEGNTYSYYLRVVQQDEHRAWSSPVWVTIDQIPEPQSPPSFKIVSITPNPFNTSTTITFSQPAQSPVTIEIWSVDGKRIRTLTSGKYYPVGTSDIEWDGRNLHGTRAGSGVYFVRIKNAHGLRSAKIVLSR